jgi:hypothetical protein
MQSLTPDGQDHLLKVLWIEDKLPTRVSSEVSGCFNLYRVWRPDELADALREKLSDVKSQRGANSYALVTFPFDGFLADFNLEAAGRDTESRSSFDRPPRPARGKAQEVASSPQVSPPVADTLGDLACKAEAAGLTAAVLTALNFETHPAVVVPYTAYPQELSRQRALIRLLSPPTLVIAHGAELDLSKESLEKKLDQFAAAYRKTLPEWANIGVVHIPPNERQRLLDRAQSCAYGDEAARRVKWDEQDSITVDTVFGRRRIACISLWFREDNTDPLLAEVTEWLNKIPVPSPVYSSAVKLAYKYWTYSETEDSKYRYILSRLIRSLESEQPGSDHEATKADIRRLCNALNIDPEAAIKNPKRTTVGADRSVPHLVVLRGVEENARRLAVFMLLTMEYAARWASTRSETDPLWAAQHSLSPLNDEATRRGQKEDRTMKFSDINVDMDDGLAGFLVVMEALGYREIKVKEGEVLLERPVQVEDLVQRLDPLPLQLLTVEQNYSEGRIYVRLKDRNIDLEELISGPGDGGLLSEERRALQEFALDIGFPPESWPQWLLKNYV